MKRVIALALALICVFTLAACSSSSNETKYAQMAVDFLEEEYVVKELPIEEGGVWVEVNPEPTDYSSSDSDEPEYEDIIARVKVSWSFPDGSRNVKNAVYFSKNGKVSSYYQWVDPNYAAEYAEREYGNEENAIAIIAALVHSTEKRNDAFCPDDVSDWIFVEEENLK